MMLNEKSIIKLYKRNIIIATGIAVSTLIAIIYLLVINYQLNINNKTGRIKLYIATTIVVIMLFTILIFIFISYKNLFIPLIILYKKITKTDIGMDIMKSQSNVLEYLFYDTNDVFKKIKSLIKLIENLNDNRPFKEILQFIFDSFSEYIPYTYIGVALIEDDGKTIRASYAVSDEVHGNLAKNMTGYKTSINVTSLGKVIESGRARVINDLDKYLKGKKINEYNKIILKGGIKSSITFPLLNKKKPVGIIFFSSNKKNVYKTEHIEFLKILANSIMLSLQQDIFVEDMILSSTLALATMTEERDPETGEHLNRMKKYSKLIAELLSKTDKYKDIIDIDYIDDIERFSPLHDIGKVAIRDDILLKPGKLSHDEFEIMKTHALYGGKVLRMADENIKKAGRSIYKMGIEIAEGHHEKWDGTGYPYGKKGEDIPLSARIVAAADVLDALTSERPYKKAFSFEESLNIIRSESGTHFDPYIVDTMIKNIDIFKISYEKYNRLTVI